MGGNDKEIKDYCNNYFMNKHDIFNNNLLRTTIIYYWI